MSAAAERRRLGSTAVEVSRLSLGCAPIANLYEAIDGDTATATVRAALDGGVNFLDTAPLYGHGLSEQRLGAALAGVPRDDVVVATKVGRLLVPDDDPGPTIFVDVPPLRPEFDFSAGATERSLTESLERLGLDRVDVLHVHDPDDHAEDALAGAFPVLRRLRDEGVVGAIGAGMNQAALLARFVREAGVDCVLLAGCYTLLDQSGLDDLLPLCEREGVSVIAAGVFNSGILADPAPGARYFYGPAPERVLAKAQAMAEVCERHGTTLRAAAMQLPSRHPAVATVLVGAGSPDHVHDALAGFDTPVPDALWDDLRSAGLLADRVPT